MLFWCCRLTYKALNLRVSEVVLQYTLGLQISGRISLEEVTLYITALVIVNLQKKKYPKKIILATLCAK